MNLAWLTVAGTYQVDDWLNRKYFDFPSAWIGSQYFEVFVWFLRFVFEALLVSCFGRYHVKIEPYEREKVLFFLSNHNISFLMQGRRNKSGRRAVALPIFLNYSSKDPFLPYQYFRILVLCHINI